MMRSTFAESQLREPARAEFAAISKIRTSGRLDVEHAFDYVCRLVDATTSDVFAYDRLDEAFRCAAEPRHRILDHVVPALADVARAETEMMFAESRPRWIEPDIRGAGSFLMIKLNERGTRTFFLVLGFDDASPVTRARATKMAPDLATLVCFHLDADMRLRESQEAFAAATGVLNQDDCGIIAVREDRSVVLTNRAAEVHLAEGSKLQVHRGMVRTAERSDARRFDEALDRVVEASHNAQMPARQAMVMLLTRRTRGKPTIIVIAPLQSNSDTSRGNGAAAVIYIYDTIENVLRGLDPLCRLLGLSGVESRLLIHLAGGKTLTEAASEMRIKIETARTYLKQIFAKTETHRQSDLVAMMTSFLRPVRGDFMYDAI